MELLDIKFECSACGQRLVVEAAAAGLETDCPCCQGRLNVPRSSRRRLSDPEAEIDSEAHLLRQELAGATLLAAEHERQAEALRERLSHARREAEEQTGLASKARTTLTALQADFTRVSRELADAAKAHAELREAHDVARQYTTAQAAQIASREREAAEALATVAALRDELRALEGRLGRVESELAGARLELEGKARLVERVAELESRREEAEALGRTCRDLREETESLRRQLNESTAGRELLALREKLEISTAEAEKAGRSAAHAADEAKRLRETQVRAQADFAALRKRCEAAEKLAGSDSEGALRHDRAVLRGIIERQKTELQDQYHIVRRMRRARMGVRSFQAALLLLVGAAFGAAIIWLQHSPLLAELLRLR